MTEARQIQSHAAPLQDREAQRLERQAAWHVDRMGVRGIPRSEQAFHLREARRIGQALLGQTSGQASGHNLLGRLALEAGEFGKAGQHLNQALRLNPQDAGIHFSLGHVALQRQQLAEAAGRFRQAMALDSEATVADQSLAYVKFRSGMYAEAFSDYRTLIRRYPNRWTLKTRLLDCAERVQADYDDPALSDDVVELLQTDDLNYQSLAPLAGSLLRHRYQLQDPDSRIDLAALVADPLLNAALPRLLFVHPELDELLATLRTTCLHHHLTLGDFDPQLLTLLQGLAWYGLNCEFVLAETDDETATLDNLVAWCAEQSAQGNISAVALPACLLALYRPLHTLSWLPAPDALRGVWPDCLHALLAAHLQDPEQEQLQVEKILSLTPLAGGVSAAVQTQYEENPYPRWQHLPRHSPTDYMAAVAAEIPAFKPRTSRQGRLHILVAGTGTGRHAIHLARHFLDTRVLAVDLSRRSLAYGETKAAQLDITNIEFRQADILHLHHVKQQFDVIECSGVLHHMEDPMAGWHQLCSRLRPGGLMKIGLYSTRARTIIHQLRAIITEQGLKPTPSDIRRFRRSVLREAGAPELATLLHSVDFYSMSGVRDLLFHVQEHTFTPAELANMIDELPLSFLGFVLPASARRSYQHFFPDDPLLNRLDNWEILERDNPELFGGMYQLYLRKE
ncbi:MAG: methyltransferase domain-containing protein [Natronospirillum sp.]|uniref:methyltransferase domain-containing protein n=1 Tax=Natronospirillum sp. TaxID=2812955 RepID=UPI0025F8BA18|nr:methyltransferase domain-containing protein [Natronospirillum sp.]MCH8551264.1 methyltransferase domain-containing protein [Natronospirillum sp.]